MAALHPIDRAKAERLTGARKAVESI